ncbi:hypothetical protein KDA23_02245 [Candidatus Saccharibacteria bacterium]|nr:hypothetical protein [Candidatus Saccharibacteria bacterium]MCB9821142.1 hypothetical protein [Candidatus Nomurabacteria bacterium]
MARTEKIGQISASKRREALKFIRSTKQFTSFDSAIEALARAMGWGHGAAYAALESLGVVVSAGRKGYSLHIVRSQTAQPAAA